MTESATTPRLLSTGIQGLDDVLHGGHAAGGLYAVEGDTPPPQPRRS